MTGSHGHNITIAFLFRRKLQWAHSYWHCVADLWNNWKNFLLIDRKVRKKNQISEYHAPSLKEYDEDNIRVID